MTTETRQAERIRREETSRRYAERFPGWTIHELGTSAGLGYCPRPLVRKHCKVYSGSGPFLGGSCFCQVEGLYFHVLDHPNYWKTPEGDLVLTGEPYRGALKSESGQRLLEGFIAECGDLGLRVDLSEDSPWNPGSTVLVTVRRERESSRISWDKHPQKTQKPKREDGRQRDNVLECEGAYAPGEPYRIDLDRCRSEIEAHGWVWHIAGKTWATDADLGALVRALRTFTTRQPQEEHTQ